MVDAAECVCGRGRVVAGACPSTCTPCIVCCEACRTDCYEACRDTSCTLCNGRGSKRRRNGDKPLTHAERVALLRRNRRVTLTFPDDAEFERASGDVVCRVCGLLFGQHPNAENIPTMHRICEGAWTREGKPDVVWVKT